MHRGLSEEAGSLAERAHIRKRKQTFRQMLEDWRRPWRFPFDAFRWLFSWLLALVSGYGYHPGRALITYVILILAFATAYFNFAPMEHVSLNHLGALVLSMTSFHGRGFFPGNDSSGRPIPLHDPLTVVAAFEALAGLLMEITLFATVTQRFFSSR